MLVGDVSIELEPQLFEFLWDIERLHRVAQETNLDGAAVCQAAQDFNDNVQLLRASRQAVMGWSHVIQAWLERKTVSSHDLPLIVHLLEALLIALSDPAWRPVSSWLSVTSLTLMFQAEVADRIVAAPGGKDYGRLAVVSQWRTDSRIVFSLPPDAFTPKPKVASAVVKLVPRAHPEPPCDIGMLEQVTAASFGQRRKMLRASLKQITPDPEKLLTELGLDPRARAETLQIADFCRIANELAKG